MNKQKNVHSIKPHKAKKPISKGYSRKIKSALLSQLKAAQTFMIVDNTLQFIYQGYLYKIEMIGEIQESIINGVHHNIIERKRLLQGLPLEK
jgi:hypothetical protein